MVALCAPTMRTGLWEDELIQINSTAQPTLLAVWQNMYGRMTDLHPPLSYILLYPFLQIFGVNDIAVRLPFLLCGLLLVPAMYWLGRTAHSHNVGLLAAFFAAVSPFENYFACQSRSYSLSTLLMALSLTMYCQLIEPENNRRSLSFAGFVVSAAALYYTEYTAGLLLPALAAATILIAFRYWRTEATRTEAKMVLKAGMGGIILAGLLFLPWLHSLALQTPHPPLNAPQPVSAWPFIIWYNTIMMLPIPAIVGIEVEKLAAVCFLIWAIHRCSKSTIPVALASARRSIGATRAPTIVLLCSLLLPCSLIGIIIPWFFGYYRYIYPYSPAGWTVLAILLCTIFARLNRTVVIALLVSTLIINGAYIAWWNTRPQSAIRGLAQDVLSGKYDNSAFLLLSDIELGPSFDYYLRAAERQAHHITVYGYPRFKDPFTIIETQEISKDFQSTEMLAQAENNIDNLQKKGCKRLILVSEFDRQVALLTTPTIPRKARFDSLRQFLDKNYKKLPPVKASTDQFTLDYDGITEGITVTVYDLTHAP
jgi:hypothetical protein